MMRNRLGTALALALAMLGSRHALTQEPDPGEIAAGIGYGVVGASLARAEEAVCRSMVNYGHVRGAFGEAVMERVVLGTRRAGGWQSISVSPKPQGIDGIYIKHGSLGRPTGLLVGEAKFGSTPLKMTKDGRQLSSTWTSPRLSYEASRYKHAGSSNSTTLQARPKGLAENPDVVKVRLPDGREGSFWRSSKSDPWAYDGPQGTLKDAQSAAVRDGRYIQAAADGKISYRQRLFKIDVTRDTISVRMQDAKPTSLGAVELKEIARVKIDAATRMSYMAGTKAEIARQLMAKNPHLGEEDAKTIATAATRKMRHLQAILSQQNRAYWLSALSDSGKAGVVGGLLSGAMDVAMQMHLRGQVDWGQAGGMALLGAGSAAAGAAAHHLVVSAAINNAVVNQLFVHTANVVGLPTGMAAASIVGQGAGGAVGSVVYAALMCLSGNMEAGDAARVAAAGTIGSAAGAAAGGGMIVFATMYGTAGTTAISGLSGAAANSAALAWLGGGSVAAGGGGTALGAAIVSGGVLVVAVAVTAVIYWGYAEYDNSEASRRHQYNADCLKSNDDVLTELCRRRWFPSPGAVQ